MSAIRKLALLCLIIGAALSSGCATPQPVRDLATRGASTVGLAEKSLQDYLAATDAQLHARSDLLRADAESMAAENLRRDLQRAYDEAAGNKRPDDPAALINKMAAIRSGARDKQQKQFAKIAADNTFDDSTIAKVPTEKLAAAKKSFALLSEELTPDEWLKLVGGYAKVISDGIEQLDPTAKKTKGN